MQLVKGGPDLPDELIRAQEEGTLVFYCGAGISMGAGLPGFQGLVDHTYTQLGEQRNPPENEAYTQFLFDRTLALLEGRVGQKAVRRIVSERLRTNPDQVSVTHRALLGLARPVDRTRRPRLVTTNYDHLFESTARESGIEIHTEIAPRLACPKEHRWESLVYLHGRSSDEGDNTPLVLTSADFGLAYLLERWAARFVSELFARYTVLFVGYSLEDPVLRYVADGLAAEGRMAQSQRPMFALAPAQADNFAVEESRWIAKGVQPVVYDSRDHHDLLQKTLVKWCELWEGGRSSRRDVALTFGATRPASLSAREESQLLWAIRDDDVLRAFVSRETPAHIEWIGALDGMDGDTGHLRQTTNGLSRLSSALVSLAALDLANEYLIDYVLQGGCVIHAEFATAVKRGLANGVRAESVKAFWTLVLGTNPRTGPGSYSSFDTISPFGLMQLLEPVLRWTQRFVEREHAEVVSVIDLGVVSIDLAVGHNGDRLLDQIRAAPPDFLYSMTFSLTERLYSVMELFRLAGRADDSRDPSMLERPSIAPHEQNSSHHGWTLLVDLLLLAFDELAVRDPELARAQVCHWLSLGYPVFRRIVLAVADTTNCLSLERKLDLVLGHE